MKLSYVLLVAISAAVLSSCKKGEDPTPQTPIEQPANGGENCNEPHYCPACGMG